MHGPLNVKFGTYFPAQTQSPLYLPTIVFGNILVFIFIGRHFPQYPLSRSQIIRNGLPLK